MGRTTADDGPRRVQHQELRIRTGEHAHHRQRAPSAQPRTQRPRWAKRRRLPQHQHQRKPRRGPRAHPRRARRRARRRRRRRSGRDPRPARAQRLRAPPALLPRALRQPGAGAAGRRGLLRGPRRARARPRARAQRLARVRRVLPQGLRLGAGGEAARHLWRPRGLLGRGPRGELLQHAAHVARRRRGGTLPGASGLLPLPSSSYGFG